MGKQRDRERGRGRKQGEGGRTVRLEELIREEIGLLLRGAIRDPRLADVTVTMVELSRDGSRARIWFTAENDDDNDNKIEALDRAAGFLRTQLADGLGLKRTPELRFRRDPVSHAFVSGISTKETI